jgi:hypothetical protein
LGKLMMFIICSEIIVVLIGLACWFDGRDWKLIMALLFSLQMTIIFLAGVRIFKVSDSAASVVLIYTIMLTLSCLATLKFRIPPDELKSLDIHNFLNIFRYQTIPFFVAWTLLNGWCFAVYCLRLVRYLMMDTVVDNSAPKSETPTKPPTSQD